MKIIQSVNPYNLEVLREFEELSTGKINKAIEQADIAFRDWRKTSFEHRRALMLRLAGLLLERENELARLITLEMGKVIGESLAEIKKCAWVCRYYAENAESFLADEKLAVSEAESYIAYDPVGIVLAIMPWNFPFWQVFRFAAPGIMAGNTGLLKHASNVPQCALAIERLFIDAGFPEGVFRTLMIGSGQVGRIIDDFRVRAVTLTGSDPAGRKVAEAAGRNLKKLVLELGGSDPFIVLKDANIDEAARVGVKARMINCGQSCIAAKRFIVEKSVLEEYTEKYLSLMNALKGGDPLNAGVDYGPMARPDLLAELKGQVDESVRLGSNKLNAGASPENDHNIYPATVLNQVKPGMPAFDDELFGPVASIIEAEDDSEAIILANRSRFGLGASLWTEDMDKAKALAREIESGSVFVNAMVASHPMVPFGGVKDSGYGRELSYAGIREFMNLKSIWIRTD